jgi:hypothetical protein
MAANDACTPLTLVLLLLPIAATARADSAPIDYNRDVRPILSKHCFACHGQDEGQRKKGLRLDRRDAATRPLDDGNTAIVPGDPDGSELVFRVTEMDETVRMPPPKAGEPLSPPEIETLRRWVEQGATYSEHWAFTAPQDRSLPEVQDRAWPRNGIDAWILQRLEREGLRPSAEADRDLLLRRASLDLRGLPPSPEEVDAYERDLGPVAYERAVDRFLADPAYGERWARMWLDLARYADSAGYGSDPLRPNMYRYRDWVIDAFNRNVPYDRFTTLQLAGDLLPDGPPDRAIATAFHRNTMTNTEGGTDDEEFRVAAVKDRTDSTMQVWMGLTFGCAKCHTHKYDPISHQEYYSLFAFFNQTADTDQPDERPTIPAPTPEIERKRAELDAQIADRRRQLESPAPELAKGQEAWEALLRDHSPPPARFAPLFAGVAGATRAARRGAVPAAILAIVDTPGDRRSAEENEAVSLHYRAKVSPERKPLRDEIASLEKARPVIPLLPVMVELPADKRRATHLLNKGNFLDPGATAEPGVPSAFHPLAADAPRDRLGLARWLVDPRNPLTARVAVNRLWAQVFGLGLVETEEDFGTQGEPPSHPELLDWLAIEYARCGWDTKALLRLIVTSSTYRQSSRVTPELLAKDPRNRLLARSPRYRLEAESIRDQALALSGLLSRKLGGPSVFPPQPDGLWQAAFNGQRTWTTSAGRDRHRRGLYTFWRRTVPYPSMAAFDAPSREICSVRRTRTNTPLQAFVTLNDPVYVEAAQAMARRIVREGGTSVEDRVRYALKLALGRPPQSEQVARLAELYESELGRYRNDARAALALATEPLGPLPEGMDPAELAAWTTVANVLLNLDAVLTRG